MIKMKKDKEASRIVTTMPEALRHGKWLDRQPKEIKDLSRLFKVWLRLYFNLPSPPEHHLKTKECLTLAEVIGCQGDLNGVGSLSRLHMDKCPYCTAMLQAYEDERNALDIEKNLEGWWKESRVQGAKSRTRRCQCLTLKELKSYVRGELDKNRKEHACSCSFCKKLMVAADDMT